MKIKEFFKPTIGKIIILLIFITSWALSYFILITHRVWYFRFFPLKFFILDRIIHFLINIFPFIPPGLEFFIFAMFSYFISCSIVILWNERFGKKARAYIIISLIFFLILFFIFAIFLPLTGTITLEKRFLSEELNRERVFSGGDLLLQELTIKNNLILPAKYKLPGIAVCVYDIEKKVIPIEYWTAYKSEGGGYLSHTYQSTQNVFFVISLGAKEEKKVYISDMIGMHTLKTDMFERYKSEVDELLFFETEDVGNVRKYCQEITEEDINKAERIKITNK